MSFLYCDVLIMLTHDLCLQRMGRLSRLRRDQPNKKIQFLKNSNVKKLANLNQGNRKTQLKIGLLNVDHLSLSTYHEVVTTIQAEDPDIVFLLETFRTVEDSHDDLSLPNYIYHEALRSEVAEDKSGGGIVAFCKISEGLHFVRYDPVIDCPQEHFVAKERLWVTITNDNQKKTAICGVYLACQLPDDKYGQWNELIYSRLQKEVIALRSQGYRCILVGDFNGWVGVTHRMEE